MPFNYNIDAPSANVGGLGNLVKQASRSPLDALGKTMTELDTIATQRGKEQYSTGLSALLSEAKTSQDLAAINVDPSRITPELSKLYESKQSQFANLDRLAQQEKKFIYGKERDIIADQFKGAEFTQAQDIAEQIQENKDRQFGLDKIRQKRVLENTSFNNMLAMKKFDEIKKQNELGNALEKLKITGKQKVPKQSIVDVAIEKEQGKEIAKLTTQTHDEATKVVTRGMSQDNWLLKTQPSADQVRVFSSGQNVYLSDPTIPPQDKRLYQGMSDKQKVNFIYARQGLSAKQKGGLTQLLQPNIFGASDITLEQLNRQ